MSDFDLDAIRERQARARAEAVPLDDDTRHLSRIEIDNCGMCDDDGYRGAAVCDHRRHSTPEGRQAARDALRVALAKREGSLRPPSVHVGRSSGQEPPTMHPRPTEGR